jgi:hypothetical protein
VADSGDGEAEGVGRFFQTQPAEIAQLNDADLALVELRQGAQSVVEREKLRRLPVRKRQSFVERKFLPAAAAFVRRARIRPGSGASTATPCRKNAAGSAIRESPA